MKHIRPIKYSNYKSSIAQLGVCVQKKLRKSDKKPHLFRMGVIVWRGASSGPEIPPKRTVQPAPSVRRAQAVPMVAVMYPIFLPTPSARGATPPATIKEVFEDISIHAPREGSDRT